MRVLRHIVAFLFILNVQLQCESFHVPGASRTPHGVGGHDMPASSIATSPTSTATRRRMLLSRIPSPERAPYNSDRRGYNSAASSQRGAAWGSPPLRASSSPGDLQRRSHQSAKKGEDDEVALPTQNLTEKSMTLNLVVNAALLAGVALFAFVTFLTVDSEFSRGWTTGELVFRVPIDNWQAYTGSLRDNPVLVKACTSGTVYALGDWMAQIFEGTALADIKRGRVLRSALAGLLLHGPLSHVWYDLCETLFDVIGWNGYWWVAGPKIITDQTLWGPLWNAVYISFLGILKRDSVATIKEAIVSTALPLLLAGIRLWPLAHLVTYGLIPKENRLLWVDFIEIVWVTILSRQTAEQSRSSPTSHEDYSSSVEDDADRLNESR